MKWVFVAVGAATVAQGIDVDYGATWQLPRASINRGAAGACLWSNPLEGCRDVFFFVSWEFVSELRRGICGVQPKVRCPMTKRQADAGDGWRVLGDLREGLQDSGGSVCRRIVAEAYVACVAEAYVACSNDPTCSKVACMVGLWESGASQRQMWRAGD